MLEIMTWSRLGGVHLRFTGTGRNAGQLGDQPLVYADAPQEDLLVQELVVVMQQDGRVVHGGKSDGRDANLKTMTKPITWHKTEGLQQIGPSGWFVLTARMKRLSVAAGKISFFRVTFLPLENNKWLCFWCRLQFLTIIISKHTIQQRSSVFLNGPLKVKPFLAATCATK